jgi:hypothetical protein
VLTRRFTKVKFLNLGKKCDQRAQVHRKLRHFTSVGCGYPIELAETPAMRWTKKIFMMLVIGLLAIQFIPVEQSNPSDRNRFAAPAEVETILRRACYDCHSNETRWPWYARVAPISLLLARDVKEGRRELNFSIWDSYEQRRKTRKLKEIIKEVDEGDMPPWYYVPVHPDAKLSQRDREAIVKWSKQQ